MQNLEQLIDEIVSNLGYELITVERDNNGKSSVLRIFIDQQDDGITLDDCVKVSRQISTVLDVNDPIDEKYVLEVSSPGIDRPLVKFEHFEKYVGQKIKLTSKIHVLGRRRFSGELLQANNNQIVIDVDGQEYEIEFDNIEKANLSPVW